MISVTMWYYLRSKLNILCFYQFYDIEFLFQINFVPPILKALFYICLIFWMTVGHALKGRNLIRYYRYHKVLLRFCILSSLSFLCYELWQLNICSITQFVRWFIPRYSSLLIDVFMLSIIRRAVYLLLTFKYSISPVKLI